MLPGKVVVLDVGKTSAKLSLWNEEGELAAERSRYNARVEENGSRWLDTEGIEAWASAVLAEFGAMGSITAIVPVAHGAAAALVRNGRLASPVRDYEDPIPTGLRESYDAQRDPFELTGSPALPGGLNLGVQLHRVEHEHHAPLTQDTRIVPWPQYWAWRLSGVMASEVTSLGCHTDLWRPCEQGPSHLARKRGWWESMAPLVRADVVLGELTDEWVERTGLGKQVRVLCGIHDSNAALHGVRAFPTCVDQEVSVLSTGTWFVAMRGVLNSASVDIASIPEERDCLVNVDCESKPVPSARFMGGRELELIGVGEGINEPIDMQVLSEVVTEGIMVLPGWVADVGPYSSSGGRWSRDPGTRKQRIAAAGLYAALMADTCLELIGARGTLVVEGRFASMEVFVRGLATIRRDAQIFVNHSEESSVACGALRLVVPTLRRADTLVRVAPLDMDLADYREHWRDQAEEYSLNCARRVI